MVKRKIIEIVEEKCNGCGNCIPGCPEGALQVIDGKARLVSDLFCDGLGACIGECPQGAMKVIEREAEEYDEKKVMSNIVKQGDATIEAHLSHLKDHGAEDLLKQAIEYLEENNLPVPELEEEKTLPCGCPGMMEKELKTEAETTDNSENANIQSELRQWPIQLHLLSPNAPYINNSDFLLAADCTGFSFGNFHQKFIKGKILAIACPKLDSNLESYKEKLTAIIDQGNINTLTVITMQVPCCSGLVQLAKEALENAGRKIPIKSIVLSLEGNIISENWL